MSQYQSFFINAFGDSSQCEELNHFLRSHVIIRTVENAISTGTAQKNSVQTRFTEFKRLIEEILQ